jgi:hypothetical protein
MNDKPIPILAYGLIGITTLVLSYATFLDSQGVKGSPGQSSTSMLPNISSLSPFSKSATPAPTSVSQSGSILPTISPFSTTATPMPSAPIATAVPVSSTTSKAPVATKIGGRKSTRRNLVKQKNKKTRYNKQ